MLQLGFSKRATDAVLLLAPPFSSTAESRRYFAQASVAIVDSSFSLTAADETTWPIGDEHREHTDRAHTAAAAPNALESTSKQHRRAGIPGEE